MMFSSLNNNLFLLFGDMILKSRAAAFICVILQAAGRPLRMLLDMWRSATNVHLLFHKHK